MRNLPPQLPPEDQDHYLTLLSTGTPAEQAHAREQLTTHNLLLVEHVLNRFPRNIPYREDLFQVGVIGLMRAVDVYATADTPFGLLAYTSIYREMVQERSLQGFAASMNYNTANKMRNIQKAYREYPEETPIQTVVEELSERFQVGVDSVLLALTTPDGSVSISDEETGIEKTLTVDSHEEQILDEIQKEEIHTMVETLPGDECAVLKARLGLDGSPARTLEDIGTEFGWSRGRVAVLENRAFARLRHPSRSVRLMT